MRRYLLAGSMFMLFACGGSTGTGDDDGTTQMDAPPLTGDKYTLEYGPLTVAPGQEATKCVNLKLSNTAAIKVHQMHNVLSGGSHHLIVYRDDMETTERATPYDCQPFTGALNLSGMVAPVMITQKKDDALTLPDRVAYTFAPGQMIRIEMHYINSTDAPIDVRATSEFYAVPDSEIDHEANILFIGTPDINIPAGATMDVQTYFTPSRAQLDLANAKFFAITGHTHHHGLNVTVSTSATTAGARTSVYAPSPFDWAEPETTVHRPEFTMPTGLQAGFDFKCSYHNTSTPDGPVRRVGQRRDVLLLGLLLPVEGLARLRAHGAVRRPRHLLPRRRRDHLQHDQPVAAPAARGLGTQEPSNNWTPLVDRLAGEDAGCACPQQNRPSRTRDSRGVQQLDASCRSACRRGRRLRRPQQIVPRGLGTQPPGQVSVSPVAASPSHRAPHVWPARQAQLAPPAAARQPGAGVVVARPGHVGGGAHAVLGRQLALPVAARERARIEPARAALVQVGAGERRLARARVDDAVAGARALGHEQRRARRRARHAAAGLVGGAAGVRGEVAVEVRPAHRAAAAAARGPGRSDVVAGVVAARGEGEGESESEQPAGGGRHRARKLTARAGRRSRDRPPACRPYPSCDVRGADPNHR